MNTQISILILYLLSLVRADYNTTPIPHSNKFKPAVKSGVILDEALFEASGLVASRINKGTFWAINDSGNEAMLYLIDAKGHTIISYMIEKASNTDWEDLAIYTDELGKSKLYIGDVGDNYAQRENINVLVFDEPKFCDSENTVLTDYKNYQFKYPDGARDSETIMVDPLTSSLFILSKREENIRIYEAPATLTQSTVMELTFKESLPFHNVTSGDISVNGKEILLKSYDSIYYWNRAAHEAIPEVMTREHELLNYNPEPQGESIAWSVDNNGFYTLSEKRGAGDQILYFFGRN